MKTKAFFNHLRSSLRGRVWVGLSPLHLNRVWGWLLLAFFIFSSPLGRGWGWAVTASAQEAYACFAFSNATLTFYYDDLRSTRNDRTYNLNSDSGSPGWVSDGIYTYIAEVVFDSSFADARPTTTRSWFFDMKSLQSITGMEYLNTSEVTDMSWMFSDLVLKSLDLSSFNTAKVTNMTGMFTNSDQLETIYVGNGWSTAAVTNSVEMFLGCTSLVGGKGTVYDANHTDVAYAHLDGGTSNPGYFTNGAKYDPVMLPANEDYIGLTSFRADWTDETTEANVASYTLAVNPKIDESMLLASLYGSWYTDSYADITLPAPWGGVNVRGGKGAIYVKNNYNGHPTGYITYTIPEGYINATFSLLITTGSGSYAAGNYTVYTPQTTAVGHNFVAEETYTWLVTASSGEKITVYTTDSETSPDIALMEVYAIGNAEGQLISGITNKFYTVENLEAGSTYQYMVKALYADGKESGWSNIEEVTMGCPPYYVVFDSSTATLTFYNDGQQASHNATTEKVYNLNEGNEEPGWCADGSNTSVTRVVFDPSFADARPTSTAEWFSSMFNLVTIDGLIYLNTSEVTTMKSMFNDCSGVLTADLSSFDTRNVSDMSAMFAFCVAEELDLSSFSTENVTNMSGMFSFDSSLKTIYVGDKWTTEAVTSSTMMFYGCERITGGMGTTYDENNTDVAYAHIDGGTDNPGYFTEAPKPYAVYDSSNTTLTFYYDGERSSHNGEGVLVYDLNTDKQNPGWLGQYGNKDITTVIFDPSFADARPTTTYKWFYMVYWLNNITGLEYLNTSEVTDMSYMFGSTELESLDLSTFDTSNVTDMSYMFGDNGYLTSVNVSSFDTQNVRYMEGMFYESSALTSLDLSNFNTQNVKSFKDMFFDCVGLTSLDLSNFDTREAEIMKQMFIDCTYLTNLNLSGFNTSHVCDMSSMFSGCSSLTALDLSSFDTSDLLLTNYMFGGCSNLTTIYVGDGWDEGGIEDSDGMFSGCTNIKGGMGTTYDASHVDKAYAHIDGGTDNPGYFTAPPKPYVVYTSGNNTLTFYHDGQRASHNGETEKVYDLNEGSNDPGWYSDGSYANVTKVVFHESFADARPTSTYVWFFGMEYLTTITGIEYLNTSEVTTMRSMFNGCSRLTSLDLSHFNTEKVIEMYAMFASCYSLSSLDLSDFNTCNVTDMSNMFYQCMSLTSLDLSSFNTANVTNMIYMFNSCNSIITIFVGNGWTTAGLSTSAIPAMFNNCEKLVGGMGTTYDKNQTFSTYAHIDGGPDNPGYFTESTKPYAVYNSSNTTLTLYNDGQRASHNATTEKVYDLDEEEEWPVWSTDGNYKYVTTVVFDPSFANARPIRTSRWFDKMFELTSIVGIEYLNTRKVKNMNGMFSNCTSLTSLNVSNFNTSNVTSMNSMFYDCSGLISLDLSNFNTAKVTDMCNMFYSTENLKTIYVGSGWSTAAVTNSVEMFQGCTSLVGGKGTAYDANHTDVAYAHIDGGTDNPGYFTVATKPYVVYDSSNTTLTFYKDGQQVSHNATTETVYDLNEGSTLPAWYRDLSYANVTSVVFHESFADARPTSTVGWFALMSKLTSITGIEYLNTSEVTNMYGMFYGCSSLTSLDLSHFNTSNVTSMYEMFIGCSSLTSLDLSLFNTSNVTDMREMFQYCSSLTTLDLSHFNTKNVTSMREMFSGCTGLTTLDLSNFNTENVTSMHKMFNGCTGLTSLNLSHFNTKNVTSMYAMFDGCSGLTSLDVSNFNTANMTDMFYMFCDCSGLTTLDLSHFNTSNITNFSWMFYGCNNMRTIYVGDGWSTAAVTYSYNMFTGCTSLVGGKGTAYDDNHTEAAYAHIDGGTSDPGYFTYKPAFLLGDVNGDSKVDVADITALTNYLIAYPSPSLKGWEMGTTSRLRM